MNFCAEIDMNHSFVYVLIPVPYKSIIKESKKSNHTYANIIFFNNK